jgi:hypothetical protein
MRIYDPTQPSVALHIPKTGGISLRQVMHDWFPEDRMHFHYKAGDHLPVKHVLDGNCCVYGHFNHARGMGVEEYYPDAQQLMCFFMEPFERFLSQRFFLHPNRGSHDSFNMDDEADFENWIRTRSEEQVHGCKSFSFVWQMPRRPGIEPINTMLRERFMFVGTLERAAESMACLSTILQRQPQSMLHMNPAFRRGASLKHWRPCFEKHFVDEMELYEQARAASDAMIASMK